MTIQEAHLEWYEAQLTLRALVARGFRRQKWAEDPKIMTFGARQSEDGKIWVWWAEDCTSRAKERHAAHRL